MIVHIIRRYLINCTIPILALHVNKFIHIVQIPNANKHLHEIKENLKELHNLPTNSEGNKNQTNFFENLDLSDIRKYL